MGRIKSSWVQEGIVLALRAFPYFALVHTIHKAGVWLLRNHGLFPSRDLAFYWPFSASFHWAVELALYVEAAFLLYIQWRHSVLESTVEPPQLTAAEREQIFERMLRHTDDMKAMISGWFMDTPFEELCREDLETFVAWMLLSKEAEEILPGEQRRTVTRGMAAIEQAAGYALAPRRPGQRAAPVMRHTLDPIKYKHRPLLVYLATHCLVNEVVGYLLLRRLGFRRRRAMHLTYWHRPGTPPQQQHPPLVFVHGIGLGLAMYYRLLHLLPRHRGDVFLVELPHASLKVCEFVPSAPQATASLRRMLADHGHARAVFAAHSLGTVYVSWMCRYASDAVAASVFVEPICFMLFLRTLTHNFLYQEYGGAIGYIIRSEFFLNHALRRHFWWQLKILFVEDIHHPSLVFLTEQDEVVPTQEVKRYVKEHDAAGHVAIEMIDHDFHGSWMLDPRVCARVAGGLERLWAAVAAGEAKGPAAASSSAGMAAAGQQQQRQQQRQQRAFPLLRKGLASLSRGFGLRRRWRRRSSSSSKRAAAAATPAAGKGVEASAGTAEAF